MMKNRYIITKLAINKFAINWPISVMLALTLGAIRYVSSDASSNNPNLSSNNPNLSSTHITPSFASSSADLVPQDSLKDNKSIDLDDSNSDTSIEEDYKDKLDGNFCKIQDAIDEITDKQKDMIDKLKISINLIEKERKEEQWTSRDAINLDSWKQGKGRTDQMSTPAEKLMVRSEGTHVNKQVDIINESSNMMEQANKEIGELKKNLNHLKDHRNTLTDIRLLEIKGIEGNFTNEDAKKLDSLINLESKQAKPEINLKKEKLSKKRDLDETEESVSKKLRLEEKDISTSSNSKEQGTSEQQPLSSPTQFVEDLQKTDFSSILDDIDSG